VVLLTLASLLFAAGPAWATGELSQAPGSAGCISAGKKQAKVCAKGRALAETNGVVISADGKNAYAVGYQSNSIAIFDRDPATGALTQKAGKAGCVSDKGRGGCAVGRAIEGSRAIAISPDGRNVYVASDDSSSVAIFDRDPATGDLEQKAGKAGCFSAKAEVRSCARSRGIHLATSVTVSPDGKSVYVLSYSSHGPGGTTTYSGTLSVFDRDAATGALTQPDGIAACYSKDGTRGHCTKNAALATPNRAVFSPDGKYVYVDNNSSNDLAVLSRDPATGELSLTQTAHACITQSNGKCAGTFGASSGIAISPDGKSLYVTGIVGYLGVFDRDPITGKLTQKPGSAGCFAEGAPKGVCPQTRPLREALAVAVSPDGKSVYVTAYTGSGIAIFDRDPATGALTQKAGGAGCVSDKGDGGCQAGRAFGGVLEVTFSPDGRNLYVSSIESSSVAVFNRAG
jgi:DNA-binding beta-propeller fold protein YncE